MSRSTLGGGREHAFALIIEGVEKIGQRVTDALFEAGCDDVTVSMRGGVLYLEFARAAPSLEDAVGSAIRDVLRSGIGAHVVRVERVGC